MQLRADTVHVWYLDASALVKLVVRMFYHAHPNYHATSLCLMEALGVLKGKWNRSQLTHDEYFQASRRLIIDAWGKKIKVDNVDLFTPQGLKAVEQLARKHALDLSDALQLETILHGTFQYFARDSKPILITADGNLQKAAQNEGIRAWNCAKEEAPGEA